MYTAKYLESKKYGEHGWRGQIIGIFKGEDQVGSFVRNYGSFGVETFKPFERNGEWYALYSPDYTALSVMKLPECIKIGGEEPDSFGFCPVDVYIPTYQIRKTYRVSPEDLHKYPECNHHWLIKDRFEKEYDPELWGTNNEIWEMDPKIYYENFAFLSGCVWGDDSSWKIELRDISEAHLGIIKKVEGWGYYEKSPRLSLQDSINLNAFPYYEGKTNQDINVEMSITKTIRLEIPEGEYKIGLKFFD